MATTGQVSWLDMIPGARQGVSYLMGQVAAFQRLPARFQAIETNAVTAKRAAENRGDMGTATQLALVIQGAGDLQNQFGVTLGKLSDVLDGLRTSGLAQVTPVQLAAQAAEVAAEMSSIFSATSDLEGTLYQQAANVLTPAELAQLQAAAPSGAVTTSFPGGIIGKYAVVGGGLLLAAMFFMRRRKAA